MTNVRYFPVMEGFAFPRHNHWLLLNRWLLPNGMQHFLIRVLYITLFIIQVFGFLGKGIELIHGCLRLAGFPFIVGTDISDGDGSLGQKFTVLLMLANTLSYTLIDILSLHRCLLALATGPRTPILLILSLLVLQLFIHFCSHKLSNDVFYSRTHFHS